MRRKKKILIFLGIILSVLLLVSSVTAVNINQSNAFKNNRIETELDLKEENTGYEAKEKNNSKQKTGCPLCANVSSGENPVPSDLLSLLIYLALTTSCWLDCMGLSYMMLPEATIAALMCCAAAPVAVNPCCIYLAGEFGVYSISCVVQCI